MNIHIQNQALPILTNENYRTKHNCLHYLFISMDNTSKPSLNQPPLHADD
jgi:hypothetical protein